MTLSRRVQRHYIHRLRYTKVIRALRLRRVAQIPQYVLSSYSPTAVIVREIEKLRTLLDKQGTTLPQRF